MHAAHYTSTPLLVGELEWLLGAGVYKQVPIRARGPHSLRELQQFPQAL